MAIIELGYGQTKLHFTYSEMRFRVLDAASTAHAAQSALSDMEIMAGIDAPILSPLLEEIINQGESVLIVVSDATRQTASGQIVNLLVRRLVQHGTAPGDINIIFATGIHRPVTADEKRELLTPFVLQRIKTLDHNPDDAAQFIRFGETTNGAPIELNRALREHDHVILTGGIGFHYFAGFTGGRKSICPGLASAETIAATHILALDFENGGGRHAGVGCGLLDGNRVHEACESIAAEINPSFLINTVVDKDGRAVHVYAGDWRAAHRTGCVEYARDHSIKIDAKREIVVASCGGAPYDINLIQAHKTLEMAAQACTAGGAIVLVAKCEEGFGRKDFLKWFDAEDSHALAESLRERYEVNGQTAWALLTKTEAFKIYLVSDLPDEDARQMRMVPARSIDDALAQANAEAEAGYVLPHGASFLPVVD
jgi:nickel-dependent lactate racemase